MSTKKLILLSLCSILILVTTIIFLKLDIPERISQSMNREHSIEPKSNEGEVNNLSKFNLENVPKEADVDVIDEYYNSLSEEDQVLFEEVMNDGQSVKSRVFITNLNLITDILTLQALSDISGAAGEYLNSHGYSGYHELTIIQDTIIADKYYPKFTCEIKDIPDKKLEIRYNLEKYEFEFQLL